ncbi:MAG: hypothetical protein Q8909_07615 [Bacteroidota bacterium]|nr:hypothetical protein [Bacteroidota bacterium]
MKIIDSEKSKAQKRPYSPPLIGEVKIDNEISVIMVSNPVIGPGEGKVMNTPDFFNNDPYKSNLG